MLKKRLSKIKKSSLEKRAFISYETRNDGYKKTSVFKSKKKQKQAIALEQLPSYVINFLEKHFKKAVLMVHEYSDGKLVKLPGKVRGNAAYNYFMGKRNEDAINQLSNMSGTKLFIGAGGKYNKNSVKDKFDSWRRVGVTFSPFMNYLRRHNFGSYVKTLEAHKNGGAHIHMAICYKGELEYEQGFYINEKGDKILETDDSGNPVYRLTDKELVNGIKNAWKRNYPGEVDLDQIDIRVIHSKNAIQYLSKEVGKQGNCESSFKRAVRGEATVRDIQKLWGLYFCLKLKMRRVGYSRDLTPEPLDKVMNNTINEDGPYIINSMPVPKSYVGKDKILPISGVLKPGTREYKMVIELLREIKRQKAETEKIVDDALSEIL